ncbi:hypothetical protein H4R18_005353 [Coemansia javaensis]|uniref:Uncharacterized protein n=1 Tax=Coemansia javaensis TaxID=2761396 RepID=A0A9W8H263_9FUNG|nr:hypothetical protein H4R18_005353 [Coemansia javaensis]
MDASAVSSVPVLSRKIKALLGSASPHSSKTSTPAASQRSSVSTGDFAIRKPAKPEGRPSYEVRVLSLLSR